MKKKLYIAKKACLDPITNEIYYKCEIDPDDIAAALLAEDISSDKVNMIVDIIANPQKANITEVEIEDEDASSIACAIGDYYIERFFRLPNTTNNAEAKALKRAEVAAMDGISIGGLGTLREVRDLVHELALRHDIKAGIVKHTAELECFCDYAGEEWEPKPEVKWAYIWEALLKEAAEIHKQHPEGITGRADENDWILFQQNEACQAAEELGVDMYDFYDYAKMEGYVTLEADVYHIMPYGDGSLKIYPIPNFYPDFPF